MEEGDSVLEEREDEMIDEEQRRLIGDDEAIDCDALSVTSCSVLCSGA